MSLTERLQADESGPTSVPSFEAVLLRMAKAVAQGVGAAELVQDFCRSVRECFGLDGVCCWRLTANSLEVFEGDGQCCEQIRGMRLKLSDSAPVVEAVHTRRPVLLNNITEETDLGVLKGHSVRSLLTLPVQVAGDVTGAISLMHATQPEFFTDEIVTRISVLAVQLGASIETAQLASGSREQRRRAEAMIEAAGALHTSLDLGSVRDQLAERVLQALDAELAALLEVRERSCRVVGLAFGDKLGGLQADASSIARFGERLAQESAREYPLIVELKDDPIGLPMVPGGEALVVPMRASTAVLQLIVYKGPDHHFNESEISLARAISGVGALAIQNSQLYATTSNQAHELRQLLEIATELSSVGALDQFLKKFVSRAAQFLGFERSFIALAEDDGECHVRFASEKGNIVPRAIIVPEVVRKAVLSERNVFWTNNARKHPLADSPFLAEFGIAQVLAAPLFGADGDPLGIFGVLDRRDGLDISPEDLARAKALAAQVSVVLESTRNLHLAEEHRKRSEDLMSLALEVSSSIRLPELVNSLARRAVDMLAGSGAALALSRSGAMETVYVHSAKTDVDKSLLRRLNAALTDLAGRPGAAVRFGSADHILGAALAEALEWFDVTVANLTGPDGDLIGLLCIANRGRDLEPVERSLLQALVGHASVALDNSRLFTRIAQSNTQWIELFDSITDLIVAHDQNHRVLRVNRSMADFIGVRPAELIGVNMRALLATAQEPGLDPCPLCRSRLEPTDEYLLPLLERTYLVSTSRVHGSLDEGMQTVHVLKDITDRREAERRYRELFDNIQEGLFFSSPEGRFVEVNDALVRMLGYESREELFQIDIARKLYPDPEKREVFRKKLEHEGTLRNYEEALIRKDGTFIHTLQNAFAVRDSHGRIVQYRGLILDITELKAFQAELQRQRDFNVKILENTQNLIVVADTVGLISYANQRCYAVAGYKPGELVGHRLIEMVTPAKRAALADALEQTLLGEQVDNLELPLTTGENQVGHFSINLSPMRDEQGQVTSIVVVMSDITDIAVLQAKLTQTEKMAAVGQLVSGVAHEVNNPLTAILGFADLLSSQDNIPESARHDLEIIIQECQRTKQIVQNLLRFARQTPPRHELVDLKGVLQRTLQLRSYDFANHSVVIEENYAADLPALMGDTHQLQQVFLNILNNAYDAIRETGKSGKIEVTTELSNNHVEIAFADNGPGIRAVDRIFDPFYTTKEVGKGTGLGLSICYGIIREHGGEIVAGNRLGGSGAVFTVRLPVKRKEMAAAAGGSA
jgi:two-component system NtrC family sensor kinase